jgi:uncharacterized membrane protein
MDSKVKTRPNHYEILGLKPAADDDEIAQAFAALMRLPHRMSDIAQIGVAFDTLRNPAKRRAYDQSQGLRAEPKPRYASGVSGYSMSARFAGSPPIDAAYPKATVSAQAPSQRMDPPPKPEASLTATRPDPIIQPPQNRSTPRPEPELPDFLAVARARMEHARDAQERVVDWKYPVFAFGSLVLAVVLIGAWAGAHVQNSVEPQQDQAAQSMTLPAARPHPSEDVPSVGATPPAMKPETRLVDRYSATSARIKSNRSPQTSGRGEDRLAQISQSLASAPEPSPSTEGATQEVAADSAEAPAVAASLPLPNAIVARTLGRLGYACGEVVSAAAVEGQPAGVFKVTCTSGQSYRAAPVGGRYHFRRWGRS